MLILIKLKPTLVALCLSVCSFFPAQHSFAWGKTGHQIVAHIATHFLDPTTANLVQMYLGTTTFEDAEVWMDDMPPYMWRTA